MSPSQQKEFVQKITDDNVFNGYEDIQAAQKAGVRLQSPFSKMLELAEELKKELCAFKNERLKITMPLLHEERMIRFLGWPWFSAVDANNEDVEITEETPLDNISYDFLSLARVLTYARYSRARYMSHLRANGDSEDERTSFTGDIIVEAFYPGDKIYQTYLPATDLRVPQWVPSCQNPERSCNGEHLYVNLPLSGHKWNDRLVVQRR